MKLAVASVTAVLITVVPHALKGPRSLKVNLCPGLKVVVSPDFFSKLISKLSDLTVLS